MAARVESGPAGSGRRAPRRVSASPASAGGRFCKRKGCPMLKLTSVSRAYRSGSRQVAALREVTIGATAGEFVAVKGPSGCGKSTLLLTCGGLLSPDSGSVLVTDVDPYALGPNERARFRAEHIGFLFQRFHLVPYLDLVDNVLVSDLPLRKEGARERAETLIEQFGLASRRDHTPGELSTGESQRVGLARAVGAVRVQVDAAYRRHGDDVLVELHRAVEIRDHHPDVDDRARHLLRRWRGGSHPGGPGDGNDRSDESERGDVEFLHGGVLGKLIRHNGEQEHQSTSARPRLPIAGPRARRRNAVGVLSQAATASMCPGPRPA